MWPRWNDWLRELGIQRTAQGSGKLLSARAINVASSL
jgi:hypothetical protein